MRPSTKFLYCILLKYLDRQARKNSVDPGHMPQKSVFNQDLHCWTLLKQFLNTSIHVHSKLDMFKF